MSLQYLGFQLQLLMIPFLAGLCVGQIVFEDNIRRPPGFICTTPDRKRGTCERWTQCQSLSKKIKSWDELRSYSCGFAGTEPRVCCPSPLQPDTPSRPTDIVYQPNMNSGSTNTASGNTVSKPRTNPSRSSGNGKPTFLPEDCGSFLFAQLRIMGSEKAEKGKWPWMVLIFEVKRNGSKRPECGGALVTARHVITAAHCVVKRGTITPLDPRRLLVRVGAHDLSDETDPNTMDVGVKAVRMHEDYDNRVRTDDIAVLLLDQPVLFTNYTAPICLPYDSLRNEDLSGKSSTITGFGLTNNGSYSDVLMEVHFFIQDQEMCRRTYEPDLIRITDRHLCAGTLDGSKDSCQGDSGGPLVTPGPGVPGKVKRFYLIGILSFGKNCALGGYPEVYTRVTEYLDWLTPRLAD